MLAHAILTAALLAVQTPLNQGFTHTAIDANTVGHISTISHQLTNDKPNKILIVSQFWNPSGAIGVYNPNPVGVWFSEGKWKIFNQNRATMPAGAGFFVEAFDRDSNHYTHFAAQGNIESSTTWLDHPQLNGSPNASLFVTGIYAAPPTGDDPRFTLTGVTGSGTYNTSEVSVVYQNGKWGIRNLNGGAMPVGAAFNVAVDQGQRLEATQANTTDNQTKVPIGGRNSPTLFTPIWSQSRTASPLGIYVLSDGTLSIFSQDRTPLPTGASYFVRTRASAVPGLVGSAIIRPDSASSPILTPTNDESTHAGVQIAASGTSVVAAFERLFQGRRRISVCVSSNEGQSMSSYRDISASSSDASKPSISVSGPQYLIAWVQNNRIHFTQSTNSGASFISPIEVPNSDGATETITAAVGGQDGFIAWRDSEANIKCFSISRNATSQIVTKAVSPPQLIAKGTHAVVGVEGRFRTIDDDIDIHLFGTRDGGLNWVRGETRGDYGVQWDLKLFTDGQWVGVLYMGNRDSNHIAILERYDNFDGHNVAQRLSRYSFINLNTQNGRGYIPDRIDAQVDHYLSGAYSSSGYVTAFVQPLAIDRGDMTHEMVTVRERTPVTVLGNVSSPRRTRCVWSGTTPWVVYESGVPGRPISGFNSRQRMTLLETQEEVKEVEIASSASYLFLVWMQRSGSTWHPCFKRVRS